MHNKNMKQIKVWTDGACSGNPGAGGWCAILYYDGKTKAVSGGEKDTTNNKMELLAVINGLKTLKEPCEVTLISDSAYVVNAFNDNWITNWVNNNWENSKRQPVANKELWLDLIALTEIHKVRFTKVKGHSDDKYNNMCDDIAKLEITKL